MPPQYITLRESKPVVILCILASSQVYHDRVHSVYLEGTISHNEGHVIDSRMLSTRLCQTLRELLAGHHK